MSVESFCRVLHEAKLGKNDQEWFPRWIRRYASSVEVVGGRLPISQEEVIQFLRSLLQSRTPAWQRLQAVFSPFPTVAGGNAPGMRYNQVPVGRRLSPPRLTKSVEDGLWPNDRCDQRFLGVR